MARITKEELDKFRRQLISNTVSSVGGILFYLGMRDWLIDTFNLGPGQYAVAGLILMAAAYMYGLDVFDG